jgi:aryl-alcohol dehydrogenase-like predicted oxidoreductase
VLSRGGITAPISGARTVDQLEDNLGSVGWELEADHRNALFWASAFPRGYPYDFIEFANHD